jgi:hypothetical protein
MMSFKQIHYQLIAPMLIHKYSYLMWVEWRYIHTYTHTYTYTYSICIKNTLPRTLHIYIIEWTFYLPVCTKGLVFSGELNREQVEAAGLPVSPGVLLSSGDVFQSHIPDVWKIGSACRTTLDFHFVWCVIIIIGKWT